MSKYNNNTPGDIASKTEVIPVVDKSDEEFLLHEDQPDGEMPMLPIRGNTLFPGVVIPIAIGRKSSVKLVREAEAKSCRIACFTQCDDEEEPTRDDLFETGVIARVLRVIELPNQDLMAVLQGTMKCDLREITATKPYYKCTVNLVEENTVAAEYRNFHPKVERAARTFAEIHEYRSNGDHKSEDLLRSLRNIKSDVILVNYICSRMHADGADKQLLLEKDEIGERLTMLMGLLDNERGYIKTVEEVSQRTRQQMDQQQRDYFLHQQMRVIQDELGETSGPDMDIKNLLEKSFEQDLPEYVRVALNRSVEKLRRTPPQTPDYTVELNYAEVIVDLPWSNFSKDSHDLKRARKVLDHDHYGMEKVKDRIIEYLAVLKVRGDMKSPILCLVGPPGTGKTSLAKSVAEAMKRKYVRVALGGLHDEVEIRGHRKTYVGAMPGRIIKGMMKAGVCNPVFVLDEIDKVQGMSNHGDPTSALLEVLDPEQNNAFHDNFLDLDYDLSNVLFIATANSLSTIQPALLDRMEVIDLNGYILEEKVEIAQRHIVPRQLKEHGLDKKSVKFGKKVLVDIINDYTRESGVRQLDKTIAKIVRQRTVQVATDGTCEAEVKTTELKDILGLPIHHSDHAGKVARVGIVTGLAWTQVGGEILFIESSVSKGKGTLSLTGNLGDVMKESATLAFEYIKCNADRFGVDYDRLENSNIHVHVPEGATPKDGPSAGITMFVSMISSFTQQEVRPNVAMTGEITLRGLVTAVGGIREKILAAKRAGITEIILSEENRRDIEDIPQQYLTGLQFHYIAEMKEALPLALIAK